MPIVARKKAETKGAAAVAIVDAVDERREFLAPIIVGREQIRLVIIGRHQVEQHDADGKRFVARHARPDFLEAGEQKAGVARFVKIGFVPPAAKIPDPGKMHAEPPAVVVAAAQPLGRLGQEMLRENVGDENEIAGARVAHDIPVLPPGAADMRDVSAFKPFSGCRRHARNSRSAIPFPTRL